MVRDCQVRLVAKPIGKVSQELSPAPQGAASGLTRTGPGSRPTLPKQWYAKASLKGGEVLLTTATATEQQWHKDVDRLQACVDSFKRD